MAEVLARLVPNATATDTNSNIATGTYVDIDSTIDAADGALVVSVTDGWTGIGTANAFSFALTDLPAAAETIVSVNIRIRSRLNSRTDDLNFAKCDITGTNAPTNTVSLTNNSTLTNKSSGAISTSATPANINGWLIRVYQSDFEQQGGLDGSSHSIDEIELEVVYSTGTPAGEPTDFTEVRAERLTRSPQITRKPETQREWDQFIQEMNKLIRNEVSGFEPVLTGFSADPSDVYCWYHRFGQMVYMEFAFGLGTSSSTSFTITNLPTAITPNVQQRCLVNGIMEDSGTPQLFGSQALVGADGTIKLYPLANTNDLWTGSGDKGFSMPTGQYASILYTLRNPDKA
jgi:hypothetical protein